MPPVQPAKIAPDSPDYLNNNDAPPAYSPVAIEHFAFEKPGSNYVEPSAPPFLPDDAPTKIYVTYEDVVKWWNALSSAEQGQMKKVGGQVPFKNIKQIREDYKESYPTDYFPKKKILSSNISAVDYYMLYHFSDALKEKYQWFSGAVKDAFEIKPPKYEGEAPPPSYEEATKWWNGLKETEQREIKSHSQNFDVGSIRNQYRPYNRSIAIERPLDQFDAFDYYLFVRQPRYIRSWGYAHPYYYGRSLLDDIIFFETVRVAADLTVWGVKGAVRGGVAIAKGIGSAASSVGSKLFHGSNSNGKGNTLEGLVGLLAIVAFLAAASAAFVAAAYAVAKNVKAATNLVLGRKPLKSLWRIVCTAGAAYGGFLGGVALGAAIGSIFPGFGTMMGAIVGALCAGGGAALSKYSAQAFAKWRSEKSGDRVLSPTNPEKWNVTKIQSALAKKDIAVNESQLESLLSNLRSQKNDLRSSSKKSYVVGTKLHAEKEEYNAVRDAIAAGQNPFGKIRINKDICFQWNGKSNTFQKFNDPMPVLQGLNI